MIMMQYGKKDMYRNKRSTYLHSGEIHVSYSTNHERPLLQTIKNQGLLGEGLKLTAHLKTLVRINAGNQHLSSSSTMFSTVMKIDCAL